MTIATGIWKIGCAGVLVGLAVGCSGSADRESELDSAPAPSVELNEAGFIPVTESADDPGYCGYLEYGVDEFGGRVVEQERYYYGVINRLLGEDAELRRYTGLSTVSSCADARYFVKANNEYLDQKPGAPLDKAKLLAGFPMLPAEQPKRDPNALVDKILEGTDDAIEEIIGFGFRDAKGTMNCTGVRLSGALFLTASHCLVIKDRPAGAQYVVSFPDAWMKHVVNGDVVGDLYTTKPERCTNLAKDEKCVKLELDGYMNPNYAGTGDKRNDIAVLHVRNDYQSGFREIPQAVQEFGTDVAFISTVTPNLGDLVETVGWGPNGNYDKGLVPADYFLRAATPIPLATMDGSGPSKANGIYQGTWFSTTAADGSQICKGDSGGPSYDEYRHVIGVTSLLASGDSVHKSCAKLGTAQFMSRLDYQVLSFIPMAMLALQKGSDTTLCTCAFFPSMDDPTGKDPENPGAHVRCNIGCGDPAQWTQ